MFSSSHFSGIFPSKYCGVKCQPILQIIYIPSCLSNNGFKSKFICTCKEIAMSKLKQENDRCAIGKRLGNTSRFYMWSLPIAVYPVQH